MGISDIAASQLAKWRENPVSFVRECFPGTEPDAWQEEILSVFPREPKIVMKSCRGSGKGHAKDLKVNTPDGVRVWGELKVGDLVFAEDGSPTTVEGTYDLGLVKFYKVTFDDGSEVECSAEHLWKVRGRTEKRHGNEWAVLDTEAIVKRGVTIPSGKWRQKQFIIPRQGAAQYGYKELPIDAYVLGVWIGDGTRKTCAYTNEDFEIKEEIEKRGYSVRKKKQKDRASTFVILDSIQNLRLSGISELGSHERYIPDIYKYSSIKQRKDLLMGLMDTDGVIDIDGTSGYDTTSKRLAEDIVWLARSLGGVACIRPKIKRGRYKGKDGIIVECRDCYRVTITMPFCPYSITRRVERWHMPHERYLTRYIASIEEIGLKDGMCIRVAHPSHCYLANDFVVTHNTTLMTWLIWNFLLTRSYPRIACVSIDAVTLQNTLWSELAKWQDKSEILKDLFTWTKTKIELKDSPATWFASARTWAKNSDEQTQAQVFSGLHEENMLFVLDESGGIPRAVLKTAESALTSCKDGHIIQAGNPSQLDGVLYESCTKFKKYWYVKSITGDPDRADRTPRIDIELARREIAEYGRDDPFVRVNILGEFPESSFNALIGIDEVEAACKRSYKLADYEKSAKVLGVDVATSGVDWSVIFPRQGLQAFTPMRFRNINGTQGADIVARKINEWGADGTFIDNTGGFGSSWIDNLQRQGYSPMGVHFNERSTDDRYFNKRAQMYFDMVEWIKKGGAIPDIKELKEALVKTTYTHRGSKLLIEPKDEVKIKLGYSPDDADSLALSFSTLITKVSETNGGNNRHTYNYNPLSLDYLQGNGLDGSSKHTSNYNPLDLDYLNKG